MNRAKRILVSAALVLAPWAGPLAADPGAQALRSLNPDSDLVGNVESVLARYEDTLIDIARRYGLGYQAIRNANPGVDTWIPGEGTEVVLPRSHLLPRGHRSGIVINLPEMRLYDYTAGNGQVMTYPISIGRMDWSTPLGSLSVIQKTEQPTWTPPRSIREAYAARGESLPAVVPPGPDNPLGEFAMRLSNPNYLIHGTNWPEGIGMRATHGCIRLAPTDIEHLFSRIPVGTTVHIVNESVKAGWVGNKLFLEAHPVLEELQEPNNLTPAVRAVVMATGARPAQIDWAEVTRIANARTGIPEAVGIAQAESESVLAQQLGQETTTNAQTPPDVQANASGGGWYVQLGSFGEPGNARRLALRLEDAGFKAHLQEHRSGERDMTRVLVGPEDDANGAWALVTLLEEALGHKGHLVRLQE
ncbi:MAG: L,D-transpeptidase family protein [Thioalkalivibrio sp.]